MAGVNVRFLRRENEPMSIRAQQARDVKLRRDREDRNMAHEAQQLATKEAGQDRRTQATGEFGIAKQRMVNQAALRTTGIRQSGETQRTGMRETGATDRQIGRETGLTTRQGVKFDAQTAAAGAARTHDVQQFHRELGAKAYLGQQDPQVAAQLEQSGQWETNYQGLKPVETPMPPKAFDPVYSKEEVPRLVTPGGVIRDGKREFYDDEESIKALIKKLQEEGKTQGLR